MVLAGALRRLGTVRRARAHSSDAAGHRKAKSRKHDEIELDSVRKDKFKITYQPNSSKDNGKLTVVVLSPHKWRYEGKTIAVYGGSNRLVAQGTVTEGRLTCAVQGSMEGRVDVIVVPRDRANCPFTLRWK